jgi:Mn2+/Fe2+ NRAMP family transporter
MLSPESVMLGGRAAAAFYYGKEKREIAYISDAYRLLEPAVGNLAAKILFGVALLASGQNSTITGTLAGGALSLFAFLSGSLLLGSEIIGIVVAEYSFCKAALPLMSGTRSVRVCISLPLCGTIKTLGQMCNHGLHLEL